MSTETALPRVERLVLALSRSPLRHLFSAASAASVDLAIAALPLRHRPFAVAGLVAWHAALLPRLIERLPFSEPFRAYYRQRLREPHPEQWIAWGAGSLAAVPVAAAASDRRKPRRTPVYCALGLIALGVVTLLARREATQA